MFKTLSGAAFGVGLLLAAGPAVAAPTGQCLWSGLSGDQRQALSEALATHTQPGPAVQAAATAGIARCGFEAGPGGERRGEMLLNMMAARSQAETALAAAHVTPAALDQAYRTLDPAFHTQLLTFVRERFTGHFPTPPDEAKFTALLTRLSLTGDEPRRPMQSYLLVRASVEYIESAGAAFQPTPPAPAATAAPAAH